MPAKVHVVWFVEPLDARTSRAIADFLESGADVEVHAVEVRGVLRSMYRLTSNHQRQVLEESRGTLGLRFRIIRERNGKKDDITEVMRSRDRRHNNRRTRSGMTINQIQGKGLIQTASSLRVKNRMPTHGRS